MTSKTSSSRKRSRPVEKSKKTKALVKNKMMVIAIVLILIISGIGAIAVVLMSEPDKTGDPFAIIDTTEGTIVVELYADKVPNTCENFIKLAEVGFYDDIIFHRILDNFMIQTGGFTSDFQKKPSPYGEIDLEIDPELSHVDGAISMARRGDPDINSASSEFFICDGDQSQKLDDSVLQQFGARGYTVFGVTVEGIEVVREIASAKLDPNQINPQDQSGPPLEEIKINSIKIEYR
jgi:cyclophilin family peptidyl-prolyl cis-trans isomerase